MSVNFGDKYTSARNAAFWEAITKAMKKSDWVSQVDVMKCPDCKSERVHGSGVVKRCGHEALDVDETESVRPTKKSQ